MPWFKVDDSFESHPKVKSIAKVKSTRIKAVGLWTLAGAWSAHHLTDGFVPAYMLEEFGASVADASHLVTSGLWLATDDGYTFTNWHDWQPTKTKVEADREAAKERMRAARERKKAPGSADVRANTSERKQDRSEEVRSTQRSPTPTRPDPTRPDLEEEAASDDPAPPGRSLALVNDDRDDVDRLCQLLAEAIETTGSKKPAITVKWRNEARLMLDRDGRSEAEVESCIRWLFSSNHPDALWWRAGRIQSMPKLREKFDAMRLQAQSAPRGNRQQETDDLFARNAARLGVTGGGL